MTRSTENPQFLRGLTDNQRSLAISSTRRPPAKAPKQPEPIAIHKQNSDIAAAPPASMTWGRFRGIRSLR
jgi:hypothetical protein